MRAAHRHPVPSQPPINCSEPGDPIFPSSRSRTTAIRHPHLTGLPLVLGRFGPFPERRSGPEPDRERRIGPPTDRKDNMARPCLTPRVGMRHTGGAVRNEPAPRMHLSIRLSRLLAAAFIFAAAVSPADADETLALSVYATAGDVLHHLRLRKR